MATFLQTKKHSTDKCDAKIEGPASQGGFKKHINGFNTLSWPVTIILYAWYIFNVMSVNQIAQSFNC